MSSISSSAVPRTRRSVSIYDRVEEARERRATVLSRQPANLPTKAPPAPGPAKTAPAPPAELETLVAAPRQEEVAPSGAAVRWTIRSLAALLLILTGIAFQQIEFAPPAPPPDFAPPIVSLTPQAFGPPLLATVSHRGDRSLAPRVPVHLASAAVGSIPSLDASAPAPKAPLVMRSVEAPAAPLANPAPLVTLPNSARPPSRPRLTTLAQGGA